MGIEEGWRLLRAQKVDREVLSPEKESSGRDRRGDQSARLRHCMYACTYVHVEKKIRRQGCVWMDVYTSAGCVYIPTEDVAPESVLSDCADEAVNRL
jgi:hypothetical protein